MLYRRRHQHMSPGALEPARPDAHPAFGRTGRPGARSSCDGFQINLAARTVHREGREINLTPLEYRLLCTVVRDRGRLLTQPDPVQMTLATCGRRRGGRSRFAISGRRRAPARDSPAERPLVQGARCLGADRIGLSFKHDASNAETALSDRNGNRDARPQDSFSRAGRGCGAWRCCAWSKRRCPRHTYGRIADRRVAIAGLCLELPSARRERGCGRSGVRRYLR